MLRKALVLNKMSGQFEEASIEAELDRVKTELAEAVKKVEEFDKMKKENQKMVHTLNVIHGVMNLAGS